MRNAVSEDSIHSPRQVRVSREYLESPWKISRNQVNSQGYSTFQLTGGRILSNTDKKSGWGFD